jgi:hypothetical protein
MYRIIASKVKKNQSAILEINGDEYFLVGEGPWGYCLKRPTMFSHLIIKENQLTVHEPPTEIEHIENWPEAAEAYEERMKVATPA